MSNWSDLQAKVSALAKKPLAVGAALGMCAALYAVVSGKVDISINNTPTPAETVVATLEGPTTVPSGGFAIYYSATAGAHVTWDNHYPPGVMPPIRATDENGRTMLVFFSTVNGVYDFRLTAQLPVDGLDPIQSTRWTVNAGPSTPVVTPTPAPTPTDPVTPTPQPTPTPTPASSLIVFLYESTDGNLPSYATGAVQQLRAAGRQVRDVDDDVINGLEQIPAEIKPAVEAAKSVGLPAVVVIDQGKVVKAIKLPPTTEAILEAVK